MNLQQRRIYKRLADIDIRLARMYEGGLRVLGDASNPERVALSAHSIRESTYHLSHAGKELLSKEEAKAAGALKTSNARQLEKLFDPLGGARHFDRTLYDAWSRDFHEFFVQVSHHAKDVTFDEYCAKLEEYEDFLARYVLPLQTEIYARIDDQLAFGPSAASIQDLRFLLSRNVESYRYFFRKADARWLGFLNRKALLFPTWETADYLARIAPEAPGEVMVILESMKTHESDWATRGRIIDASIKMPSAIACRIVDKIRRENWLAEPNAGWVADSLAELASIFIADGRHQDAVTLADLLLSASKSGPDVDLRDYHLEQLLKRFSAVPAPELREYIALLVRALAKWILKEHPDSKDDNSLIWRPAIEEHDQNWDHGEARDHLITALRDALLRYIDHLRTAAKRMLPRFSTTYSN
jgi:hypothetical protein